MSDYADADLACCTYHGHGGRADDCRDWTPDHDAEEAASGVAFAPIDPEAE